VVTFEEDLSVGIELVVVVEDELLVLLEQKQQFVELLKQVEQVLELGLTLFLQIQVEELLLLQLNRLENDAPFFGSHQNPVESQQ